MSVTRPVRINDFVNLQLNDQYGKYQIKEITNNHDIIVSMMYPKENTKTVIVRFDINDQIWKFVDLSIDHNVTFEINNDEKLEIIKKYIMEANKTEFKVIPFWRINAGSKKEKTFAISQKPRLR